MTSNRIIIEPGRAEKNYWKDLWHFRELFYILSWRDIKVRYKQTVIGAAWSIIRPLLTTIIFTIVFSRLAKLDSPSGAPYAILVFAGMLPWQFFANALNEASNPQPSASRLFPDYLLIISHEKTPTLPLPGHGLHPRVRAHRAAPAPLN